MANSTGGDAAFFAGSDEANGSNKNYFRDGSYVLEVAQMKAVKGFKGKSFVGEFKIMEAEPGSINKPGEVASHALNLDKGEMQKSDMKKMCAAITGVTEQQVTVAALVQITSPAQPLRGRRVGLRVTTEKTSKGADWSRHVYRSVEQPAK